MIWAWSWTSPTVWLSLIMVSRSRRERRRRSRPTRRSSTPIWAWRIEGTTMGLLYQIFLDPFVQMGSAPDLLVQTLWEGLVAGVLYSLVALGYVLIYKASGVFNFAQGIMVVFAALTFVGIAARLRQWGVGPGDVAAYGALVLTALVMLGLAWGVERLMLRPLVNQPEIILFMATFGLTYFLI